MKKQFVILLVLLVGCKTAPIIDPQKVEVPVATKCEPTTNIDPDNNAFDRATTDMSLYDKFKLALEELNGKRSQNTQLKAALKECTK